jgi:hypothetical protein
MNVDLDIKPISMVKDYIYRELWKKYSESAFNSWVLTLTNVESLAVLGFLGALLAFAQPKAWVMIRRAVIRIKRPV